MSINSIFIRVVVYNGVTNRQSKALDYEDASVLSKSCNHGR